MLNLLRLFYFLFNSDGFSWGKALEMAIFGIFCCNVCSLQRFVNPFCLAYSEPWLHCGLDRTQFISMWELDSFGQHIQSNSTWKSYRCRIFGGWNLLRMFFFQNGPNVGNLGGSMSVIMGTSKLKKRFTWCQRQNLPCVILESKSFSTGKWEAIKIAKTAGEGSCSSHHLAI